MESVFLHLLNMSITAGWLVLAVVVLRLVFRRAPKWIHCLLWVLVALRLVFPVSIESVFSLIPSAETVPVDTFLYDTPSIHSGVPVVDAVVNPVISNGFAPQELGSVNPMHVASIIAANIWILGMAAMVLYAVIATLRLRYRVREAAYLRENIWQCDRISTPFILGVIRPRIYLPTLLGAVEAQSVVAHERAHLARRDHWWKPLGFLLLTVYWFHPLLWVGYVLLCRDIEAACDQRVVRDMDVEGRREYSRVLLACSAPRHIIAACPLAFGETGVKSRIKSVLNYKKPAFWLVVAAIVATIVAAVCLLTNPRTTVSDELDAFLSQAIIDKNAGAHTGNAYPTEAHTVFGVSRGYGHTTVYGMVLYEEYAVDEKGELKVQSGSHCPTIITVDKDKDGFYYLVDYWTPRDGADYARDIRNKFPARHEGKAMDTDGYYDTHHLTTLTKAQLHYSDIESYLSNVILSRSAIETTPGIYAAEAHRTLLTERNGDKTTAYAIVYYHEYTMVSGGEVTPSSYSSDGQLIERSGYLMPVAITMQKKGALYQLVEFWTPGENWGEEIRRKFPASIVDTALDTKNYPLSSLKEECLAKAYRYFGLESVSSFYTTGPVFGGAGVLEQNQLDALYADVPDKGAFGYLPIFAITSRAELDNIIDTYRHQMYMDTVVGDGLSPVDQLQFYDDNFFAENILLAVYYRNPSCSVAPHIAEVKHYADGQYLQVQVDVYEPETGDTAFGHWFLLCEVKRSVLRDGQQYLAKVREYVQEGVNATTHSTQATVTTSKQTAADGNLSNAYWITFSHPLYTTEAASVTGGYTPHASELKKLQDMVSRLQWYGEDIMADTAFGSEACFSLDGKTRYYINLKNQNIYDGTQIANLTQEDVSILDFLVREGNPTNAATHQLTGTMIEWSKALQYILLEVTQADQADLVGKKIKVSTRYRTGSIPVIGTPVQVGYDGTVEDGMVYGLVIKGQDADQLGGPDDDDDANTFTGKVIQVEKGMILMECYDTDKFTTVWVHLYYHADLHPRVGDEYTVMFSDGVRETAPPQVTAEVITPVSSTPKFQE